MNKTAVTLSLLTLVFSILWLVFLIAGMATAGPLDSFDRVLAHVSQPGPLFYLSYLNAALITLSATALYGVLYGLVRRTFPNGARAVQLFVPVYCAFNLFAYLSQVTIVPSLVAALRQPETAPTARLLLSQVVQEWPSSGVAFYNNLAYALLGIPSILFGLAFTRQKGALRTGGILLALNGAACILGMVGILAEIAPLASGSLIGGVLFIAALPFLAFGLRGTPDRLEEERLPAEA